MAQKPERRLSNADMFLCVGAALIATASFMLAVIPDSPDDPRVWYALALLCIGGLCGLSHPLTAIARALRA
jgi:hypothetical protein